jgi:cytochrome b6-f complex iron-sulfur subunit
VADEKKVVSPFQCRRRFLQGCAGLGALALAGEVGYGALRFIAPWGQVREYKPVPVALDQLNEGDVLRVPYGPDIALVLMLNGEAKVFNAACTHFQCLVEWDAANQQFICPCHDGIFGSDGSVISGPPPMALEEFETTTEDGTLIIGG